MNYPTLTDGTSCESSEPYPKIGLGTFVLPLAVCRSFFVLRKSPTIIYMTMSSINEYHYCREKRWEGYNMSSESAIRSFLRRRPLVGYFLLTFLISWAILIPAVYVFLQLQVETYPWWLLLLGMPGAYGPSIAAVIMAGVLEGKSGVRRLLSKFLIWRVHLTWYLFVFLTPLALLFAAIGLIALQGGGIGQFDPSNWYLLIVVYILIALPVGPLAEELGWRGYALPRLQAKYSALVSSLILGLIWTSWHIPLFWLPGAAIPSIFEVNAWSILLYLGSITGEAILLTAVYNNTKGSVLIAVISHTMFNAAGNIVFSMFPDISFSQHLQIYMANIILLWILGIMLLYLKPGTLIRENDIIS